MLKKQISVFVFCTIISIATIVAGANSVFVSLLMPLVFSAVYTVESVHSNGYGVALNIAINMAVSLVITKDLFTTFCIVPLLAVSGIIMGMSALKNLGRYIAILGGIIATGGICVAYLIYSINVLNVNPVMEMFSIMEQTLLSMTAIAELGIDLSIVSEYIAMSKNMFIAIMIIMFACIGYLITYINAFVLVFFKDGKKLDITFSEFKADGITIFVYIIAIITTLFIKEGILAIALNNIYIVLNFYLAICGASVIYYLIKRKIKAPALIKKLLGVFLLSTAFSGLFSIIFVLIALWDTRRDFRRLNKYEE